MNKSSQRRQMWLLGVVGTLVMLVAIDRVGVFDRMQGEVTHDALTARSRYLVQAAVWQQQQSFVAHSARWAEAATRASGAWEQTNRFMISAPTIELAGARFRDRVVEELRILGVEAPRAALVSHAEAPASDEAVSPMRVITLDVQFDARSHRDLYGAVDRLENLPETWTAIESIEVSGPGRIQISHTASVSLRLVAIGLIQAEVRAEVGP